MKKKTPLSSSQKKLPSSVVVGALCAFVSLTFFTLSSTEATRLPLEGARAAVQTVVSPLRSLSALVTMPFKGALHMAENAFTSQETLSSLRQQNEALTSELTALKEEQSEVARLQALLGFQSTYALQGTGARVIAGSVDSYNSTITIDKGANAGLAKGMAVTDSKGVLGQVSEVSATTSVVRLITDESSGVSALVQSSRAQGQIEGQGSLELKMSLVGTDQQVQAGDMVVTSGLGGVFPKGLPIGEVESVERPQGALFLSIKVKPLADIKNVEEVFVITETTHS